MANSTRTTGVTLILDDPRIIAILEQLETLVLLLMRPVVQRQILAFLVVVLVAWLVPIPYRLFVRWLERRYNVVEAEAEAYADKNVSVTWHIRAVRVLRAVEFLLFPVTGLLLGAFVIGAFATRSMPFGLLENLMRLLWLLLAYRVIVASLYALLNPETAKRYQRRFLAPVFAVLFAASLTIGLAGAFPLGEVELFEFMGQALSLRSIATAAAVLYLTFAFAWIIRDVLNRYLLPRTQADPGVAHTIELVVHYSVIGFGIFIAASALGFDLTALLVIFGGLSVGIGFGLQELVANFISGILLVFERTLRPGDFVEVSGQRGTLTQMGMRATVLRNIDNIELFVPNKTLLTSNVATYTLTDRTVRRTIRVGVSYDSKPSEIRDLLLEIASRHGLVLDDPAPIVYFVDFGSSSLDFELAVWTDISNALNVVSDLRFMIFSGFAKHGITIPFPQRDVHFPNQQISRLELHPAEKQITQDDVDGAHDGSDGGQDKDSVSSEEVDSEATTAIGGEDSTADESDEERLDPGRLP